jgi:hypothetical protein
MEVGRRPLAPAAPSTQSAPLAKPAAGAAPAPDGASFRKALDALGGEIDRGEALVRRAIGSGGRLGAAELIALQAGIYRYSEAIDLTAKLVDRAGNAVRTTLQSSGG